jgi:hypothetical protein
MLSSPRNSQKTVATDVSWQRLGKTNPPPHVAGYDSLNLFA